MYKHNGARIRAAIMFIYVHFYMNNEYKVCLYTQLVRVYEQSVYVVLRLYISKLRYTTIRISYDNCYSSPELVVLSPMSQ